MKKMSKIDYYLITGGLGIIGSNIVKKVIKNNKNSKCVILDNFTVYIDPIRGNYRDYRRDRFKDIFNLEDYKKSRSERVIVERGNAADPKVTLDILTKYKPKIIFHTAGMPLAKINNPVVREFKEGSVDTTSNLLECVDFVQQNSNYRLDRFLYISSSMVYGDFKKSSVSENEKLNPKEIYGTMKLAGEIVTSGMCVQHKIPYTIVRPSAVYGPTDMNQRVTQYFIEKADVGETLYIHGKNEKLDFTYVEDLVDGCILASKSLKGINQIFNITNGNARSLLDYAKILKKYFPNLKYKIVERDHKRPKRGTLNINKAKRLLKFKPKFNLEKGTEIYVKHYKNQKLTKN
tara:strand:+ start:5274 stop:6314 length:1041 start_codon:yes stop_codon:yes gene_type:complete